MGFYLRQAPEFDCQLHPPIIFAYTDLFFYSITFVYSLSILSGIFRFETKNSLLYIFCHFLFDMQMAGRKYFTFHNKSILECIPQRSCADTSDDLICNNFNRETTSPHCAFQSSSRWASLDYKRKCVLSFYNSIKVCFII